MESKNKILFICLIICFLSITAVSASDINNENQNQTINLEIENQNTTINDKNLQHTDENSPIGQENPEIIIDAEPIYINETANINITVKNATGYIIVSIDNQTFNKNLIDCQAKINISGLTAGNHNVAVFYSGDENYLANFKLETLQVKKLQTKITDIQINALPYGENSIITVIFPETVEGKVIFKLNDTFKTNITTNIYEGRAECIIPKFNAGNYTANIIYEGNDYYLINDTESVTFEIKKADPNLSLLSFSGVVYNSAQLYIMINDEINDEYLNVTIDGEKYENVPIQYGYVVLTTNVLTEYKSYNVTIEYSGNNNFKQSKTESLVSTSKITTYGITILPSDIAVYDDEIIKVIVPDHVDDVVIWVNGTKYRNHSFTNNVALFNVKGLKEGVYTVTATVNDTEFDHKNFTEIFTVSKIILPITIQLINETPIYVGDNVKINVTTPKDLFDNITIIVEGISYTQKPIDGNIIFNIPGLTEGSKTIPAIYYGDDKYKTSVENLNFTVYKLPSFINISTQTISIEDNEEIQFTLPNDAKGNITVTVNNKNYNVAVDQGKGILVLPQLSNGKYHINATYNGDGKYLSSKNNTETFNVIINSNQMDIIDEGNNTLFIYFNESAVGIVNVEIENKTFQANIIDGVAKVTFTNLTMGTHHAHVKYSNGIDPDLESVVDVHIPKYNTLLKINSSISIIDEITYINVTTPINATGNITIEVEGKSYTKTIQNGTAKFEITLTSAGNTTLFAKYTGDNSYVENTTSKILTVLKQNSQINIDVNDIYVGQSAQINITGPADISGTVIVTVNNANYTAVLSNGFGVVNVSNLEYGNYTIVANYLENSKYLSSITSENFIVNKIDTIIIAEDVISQYNDGKYLIATLIDINANKISGVNLSVNINGVKNFTTDDNGQIKISLMNLMPNNYNITVNFTGNAKYFKSTANVKVTINKATPILNAPNKSFKAKLKTKKYAVTLKDNKGKAINGVKLTLKIKGKTYTASTNSNGKATFKITKLTKKGKYTATVTFAGNAYYNSISKKAVIKLK